MKCGAGSLVPEGLAYFFWMYWLPRASRSEMLPKGAGQCVLVFSMPPVATNEWLPRADTASRSRGGCVPLMVFFYFFSEQQCSSSLFFRHIEA